MTWAEAAHDGCFEKCATDNDLTFLSIQEAKCFRNCIAKYSYFYPSLSFNLRDSGFMYQSRVNENLKKKHGIPTADMSIDIE